MSIVLDGSNGVTFPNGSNPQAAPSKVLQVVQGTTTTTTSATNSGWVDSTLTASITPLFSTSKILVFIFQPYNVNVSSTSAYAGLQLLRNSTAILVPNIDANGPYQLGTAAGGVSSNSIYGTCSMVYLDNPATTSSTTYKTQQRAYGSGMTIQTQISASVTNATSTIVLMEIAT